MDQSCNVVEVLGNNVFVFGTIEQVIDFVTLPSNGSPDARGALIRKMWSDRILGTKKKVEVRVENWMP